MILKVVLVTIYVLLTCTESSAKTRKHIVCYHGTWATYREGSGKFDVDNIDPFLCTHLMYAFFGVEESGELRVIDPYLDLEDNYGRGNIHKFNQLKIQNPTLKTLAAVGGWNEGSKNFSIVAADATKRALFVRSTVRFLQNFGFDGIDLDWEYPNQRHHLQNDDRQNFVDLLRELKDELEPFGYMLTAAVGSAENSAFISYNIPEIVKYLDLINVMAYDLHGPWENVTGLNAPLHASNKNSTSLEQQLNVEAIVKYWLKNGAPKDKLVLGVPFYGRSFTLEDPKQHTLGAPHLGRGLAGQYSMEPGVIGYNELCLELEKNEWKQEWDSIQMAPYAYKDQQWIAYENLRSIKLKTLFAKDNDLAGVMIWSIESDDFHGNCHHMKYPLLKSINSVIFDDKTPTGLTRKPTKRSSSTIHNNITANEIINGSYTKERFKCTNEKGYVRDSKDCSKFYLCHDGITYDFVCPNSLYFDSKALNCNYSTLVQCAIE